MSDQTHSDSLLPELASGEPFPTRVQRWLSLQAYGLFTSTFFGAQTPPAVLRSRFERFGGKSRESLRRKYPGLAFGDHAAGPLRIESILASAEPSCVVIHLHGGAFVFGSRASYRNRAMRLGYRFGAEVFVPEYRLAPEHPFPAALDDALAAYRYVRALRPHAPVFVTGDSAGGGLALSLMLRLRELGEPLPCGAILLSPWTDLSVSSSSAAGHRREDLWFTPSHLRQWASYYAGAADTRSPLLSPVFADLSDLPPLLVLAGEHELLLEEAARVVTIARSCGTDATLIVGREMQHDWPLTMPWLPESRQAWAAMERFVAGRIGGRATSKPTASMEHRLRGEAR